MPFLVGRIRKKFEIKACEPRGMRRTQVRRNDAGQSITPLSGFLRDLLNSGAAAAPAQFGFEDVKVFAGLTDLEELALQGETVTDAAAGYLAGLPKTAEDFYRAMAKVTGSEVRWRWMREEMIEQKRWSELIYS